MAARIGTGSGSSLAAARFWRFPAAQGSDIHTVSASGVMIFSSRVTRSSSAATTAQRADSLSQADGGGVDDEQLTAGLGEEPSERLLRRAPRCAFRAEDGEMRLNGTSKRCRAALAIVCSSGPTKPRELR